MHKKLGWVALLVVPLVVAGLAYGQSLMRGQAERPQQVEAQGYTCPVTGEELPCPNCCPLNQQK
jgi:hypothetical protein